MTNWSDTVLAGFDSVELAADVLVIGGGPAGTWAALAAAAAGASVVLADKGYCGTSGATAPSGVGVWYVPPDPEAREQARASREALGGYLSERRWMDRVLDTTYANVDRLALWGYPFPRDGEGQPAKRSLQGPEYMRLMRRRVKASGVRILDHSPALELLLDDGGVAGVPAFHARTNDAGGSRPTRWSSRPADVPSAAVRWGATCSPATEVCSRRRWEPSSPAWSSRTHTGSRRRSPR